MNDLVDEPMLRRSLRLEADEVPPWLDTRALRAAAATAEGAVEDELIVAGLLSGGLALLASSTLLDLARTALAVATSPAADPAEAVATMVAAGLVPVAAAAATMAQPGAAVAVLAFVLLASAFELAERRYGHAPA